MNKISQAILVTYKEKFYFVCGMLPNKNKCSFYEKRCDNKVECKFNLIDSVGNLLKNCLMCRNTNAIKKTLIDAKNDIKKKINKIKKDKTISILPNRCLYEMYEK